MDLERYASQVRVPVLGGVEAQRRLAASGVAIVGVGATGSALACTLARAGVGRLRLIDRDLPELSNLQRQVLYDEDDVAAGLPKAEAARRRLARINGEVEVEARVVDLGPDDARHHLSGVDLVLDGTDNFATRFVVNDACAALGTPWIYTGVVGTTVHGFPVVPGLTPCFRCYLAVAPPPGSVETCETAGVLGPAVLVAGGFGAAEALKLLTGGAPAQGLLVVDVWTREARRVAFDRDPDCPTCQGRYQHLEGGGRDETQLCGQDAVMLRPSSQGRLDLEAVARRLADLGALQRNAFLLRFEPRGAAQVLTLFPDGRAIVKGTRDPAVARSLYARFVGS